MQGLDILRLHLHVEGALRIALRKPLGFTRLRRNDRQALEVVRLVHEKLVHAQLLERHDLLVLLVVVAQALDLLASFGDHLLDVLDCARIALGSKLRLHEPPHLAFKVVHLPLPRHRQLLREGRVLHHDCVPVTIRHLREERPAVGGLHILGGHLEDVRIWERCKELVAELVEHVIRNHVHRLLEHPEMPSDHANRLHFKSLAGADAVRKAERPPTEYATCDHVRLVFAPLRVQLRYGFLGHSRRTEWKDVLREFHRHVVVHRVVERPGGRLKPLLARPEESRESLVQLLGGELLRLRLAFEDVILLRHGVLRLDFERFGVEDGAQEVLL